MLQALLSSFSPCYIYELRVKKKGTLIELILQFHARVFILEKICTILYYRFRDAMQDFS